MSIKLLIGLLTLVILFHGCIMAKIIPYGIAWGGRLENDTQMYIFESVSILINAFLITVLLLKANYIHHRFSDKWLHGILWVFQLLFILNTVGNILAKTNFEKFFCNFDICICNATLDYFKERKRHNRHFQCLNIRYRLCNLIPLSHGTFEFLFHPSANPVAVVADVVAAPFIKHRTGN